MKSILRVVTIGVGAFLSACVTITEPVPMGKNRYMITLNARGGFESDGELLSKSVQRANEFCQSQGRRAEVSSTHVSGVQMWTPQNNQVAFSCVEPQEGAPKDGSGAASQ